MPWKLIVFLLGMLILLTFAGFNYNNVSDVSLGFYVFKDVPVFISLLVSFVIGVLFSIPFAFSKRRAKKTKRQPPEGQLAAQPLPAGPEPKSAPAVEKDKPPKKKKSRKETKKAEKDSTPKADTAEKPAPERPFDPNPTDL